MADGETEEFMVIGAGGDRYALRVREITGLAARRKVLPMPGGPPAFVGLAGVRGSLTPVWSLSVLLGSGAQKAEPRWLALGAGGVSWALGFDQFEGCFRAPRAALAPVEGAAGGFARETCAFAGPPRPVLSLPLLLEAVKKRSQRQ